MTGNPGLRPTYAPDMYTRAVGAVWREIIDYSWSYSIREFREVRFIGNRTNQFGY
jgi:hypothetical protein